MLLTTIAHKFPSDTIAQPVELTLPDLRYSQPPINAGQVLSNYTPTGHYFGITRIGTFTHRTGNISSPMSELEN